MKTKFFLAASTATEVESAAASELAVLLPPHETIAKKACDKK